MRACSRRCASGADWAGRAGASRAHRRARPGLRRDRSVDRRALSGRGGVRRAARGRIAARDRVGRAPPRDRGDPAPVPASTRTSASSSRPGTRQRQAGARSVPARRRGCTRVPPESAWRSRTRAGASSRPRPRACGASASRTRYPVPGAAGRRRDHRIARRVHRGFAAQAVSAPREAGYNPPQCNTRCIFSRGASRSPPSSSRR